MKIVTILITHLRKINLNYVHLKIRFVEFKDSWNKQINF
jgi:hypothetical protein